MERRTMILFSVVWKKQGKSFIYRRFFTIGEHTRHPLRTTLQVRCMRLMRGRELLRLILNVREQKARSAYTPDLGFYRVKYPVQGEPLISIIIPNKDEKETLETCLDSIKKSTYRNYEILIVENNSTTEEIFRYYKELSDEENVRLLRWKKESITQLSTIMQLLMQREIFCYS